MNKHLSTIILIGRPNVGKSTLFNRLLGRRQAIEHATAGTTRDVIRGILWFGEKAVTIVDTAGDQVKVLGEVEKEAQTKRTEWQTKADHILFLFDASEDLNSEDRRILRALRKTGKPFTMVAAKADTNEWQQRANDEAGRLGVPLVVTSAIHKLGISELKQQLARLAIPYEVETVGDLVLIGRPNAGKSTLFNALVGRSVSITSDIPGTTRDIVTYLVPLTTGAKKRIFALHDTAGLNRRAKAMTGLDRYSTLRLQETFKLADVALLCLDGTAKPSAQDAKVAEMAIKAGLAVILVVTKWDDTKSRWREDQDEWLDTLRLRFHFAPWLPVIFVSAKTQENLAELKRQIIVAWYARHTKIESEQLKSFLAQIKSLDGRLAPISYLEQKRTDPPEIIIHTQRELPDSTGRQIINRLREHFKIGPTPIQFQWDQGRDQSKRHRRKEKA